MNLIQRGGTTISKIGANMLMFSTICLLSIKFPFMVIIGKYIFFNLITIYRMMLMERDIEGDDAVGINKREEINS